MNWIYEMVRVIMLNLEGWLQVLTVKGNNYFHFVGMKISVVDK